MLAEKNVRVAFSENDDAHSLRLCAFFVAGVFFAPCALATSPSTPCRRCEGRPACALDRACAHHGEPQRAGRGS